MIRISIGIVCSALLFSCNRRPAMQPRPRDVWAFRSVLDHKPRMLTLALDRECMAAYDLANCTLYKVWKGGVDLQGAAFTNKKNIQPTSWGTPYSDSLHRQWVVETNGQSDSFTIVNKGYSFKGNSIFIRYQLVLRSADTIAIEENPEFIRDEHGAPGLDRSFTTSGVPSNTTIMLTSPHQRFTLPNNESAHLKVWFTRLPVQRQPPDPAEYDHKGRYFMEKSDCFTCHEADRKTVGPSLQEIALHYRDQENPTAHLVTKVQKGGSGVWGAAAMTPHPTLTEPEVRTMIDYILSLSSKAKATSAPASPVKSISQEVKPGFGAPLEGLHPSYDLQTIHAANFNPRVGGIAFMPDSSMLVTTWDSVGAVFRLTGVETGDTSKIKVKRIAAGLAEPLGIEVVNGDIYVLQKQELTKLNDRDGDGIIDDYEAICNSWGVTGDFHEFAFGLIYKDGFFYATLSMAMRLMSHEREKPDRGRAVKIAMDGTYEWITWGLRTPNGIGLGPDKELFVTDNQGEWVPSNKLVHLKKNEYHGMRWGVPDSLSSPPEVALPAVWLPEDEIANSPSEPTWVREGPYKGQLFHGDVTYGGIQRDFLEKVNGEYQGAVFRFTQGLEAGINRMRWGPDNALYIGGIGMTGGWSWKEKQSGLQRLKYNGRPVFDILAIRAQPHGFDIELTEPIAGSMQLRPADVSIQQWWYLPTAEYGGPKKDLETLAVNTMTVSADRKHIVIEITGLKSRRVVFFRFPEKLISESGRKLWSGEAWYTLNAVPEK